MLHVEQNPDISGYWNDIAERYEADASRREGRAAVPRERGLQEEADDAAAVAGQAEHHLQLGRRRAARAGQGRRHRGPHARSMDAAWKDRFVPAARAGLHAATARSTACRCTSRRSASSTTRTCSPRPASTPTAIKTWDDLLAAVKKLKDAGITPIITGGGDKWPMHFYWSHLAMRIGGKDGLRRGAARRGRRLRGPDLRQGRRAASSSSPT